MLLRFTRYHPSNAPFEISPCRFQDPKSPSLQWSCFDPARFHMPYFCDRKNRGDFSLIGKGLVLRGRSADNLGLLFLLLNHFSLLRRTGAAQVHDHAIQTIQDETQQKKDQKQLRFPEQEIEKTERDDDSNYRIVLSKRDNAIQNF